jgi:hypothetical protein
MSSTEFISRLKGVGKTAFDKDQMLTDWIRVRNRIRTIRRWPQMTKW